MLRTKTIGGHSTQSTRTATASMILVEVGNQKLNDRLFAETFPGSAISSGW
jgi:hypothetical protein